MQRYTTEEGADEPINLFTHTCMQTYSKHAHSVSLSTVFLAGSNAQWHVWTDPTSPRWLLIHVCIKHKWDGLNISLMASLTLSHHHHNLPLWASLAHFCPAPVFFHSFQRLFKVITFSKRPLRMRSGNVLTLFDFWRGLSVFLIRWWHGSLHMKLQCGFQWTWGEHIYKPNQWDCSGSICLRKH